MVRARPLPGNTEIGSEAVDNEGALAWQVNRVYRT